MNLSLNNICFPMQVCGQGKKCPGANSADCFHKAHNILSERRSSHYRERADLYPLLLNLIEFFYY